MGSRQETEDMLLDNDENRDIRFVDNLRGNQNDQYSNETEMMKTKQPKQKGQRVGT